MSQQLDITAENLISQNYRPLHAGDDYDYHLTFYRSGAVVDLTSAKIWLTVKDSPDVQDANANLQLISTDSDEIEIDDAINGSFIVKFRGSGDKSTADLEGEWLYDIQIKLADGTIITIAYGAIEFLTNLTRTTS